MKQIPHVIHYCWFGGSPLPAEAEKCIASWKQFCPDCEIRRWDESNYNMDGCTYVREACREKKWALLSDYARFDILDQYGGIYLDTDVELIRPIDDILDRGPFMGIERGTDGMVAPGLGMALPQGHPVCREILETYQKQSFINPEGNGDPVTVVVHTTNVLKKYGLEQREEAQCICGIQIYPWDYFCPMDFKTGQLTLTENTRSIHHYNASWLPPQLQKTLQITFRTTRMLGPKVGYFTGRLCSLPYRVRMKYREFGFWGTVSFAAEKLGIRFARKNR